MEQLAPNFIKRLRDLESALITELRPGSISLHLKPVRYLETPAGFGSEGFGRYRFQVQTLIESTADDSLQAVSVELTVDAGEPGSVIDDISPQAGFSAVGLKRASGVQVSDQYSRTLKENASIEISGVAAKASAGAGAERTEQSSTVFTVGGERTLARVEQYLIARKIGNRAMWRALAGVGPIDAAGTEFTADVLVPADCSQVDVRIVASVEWLRAGPVPAELRRTLVLPRPAVESGPVSG